MGFGGFQTIKEYFTMASARTPFRSASSIKTLGMSVASTHRDNFPFKNEGTSLMGRWLRRGHDIGQHEL